MRRIILRCLYILYEQDGRKDSYKPAYRNAVINLMLILILHIFFFTMMFDLWDYLPLGEKFIISSVFGAALFIMGAYVLAIILINVCFKEKDVLSIQMGPREKRKGFIILMVYVVLLIASTIMLSFIKKGLV